MTAERAIATLSGGEGSWRASKLWRVHHPAMPMVLLFTDVLYEDADTYRFLVESAADILGRKLNWSVPRASDFPDYRVSGDVPLADYRGNPEWRAFLAQLREDATRAMPELVWLVEGRDPWEIYRDERFLGNSRADPCSKIDKRQPLDKWRQANCDPARDILLFGIGEDEKHRFDAVDAKGRRSGIKPRLEAKGWHCAAPLIELPPHPLKDLASEHYGLRSSRLYGLGYRHSNCGGFCCKAGMAHWQLRRRVQRERFDYDRLMERRFREFLGVNATFLRDRTGGQSRPLSLDEFDARLARQPDLDFEWLPGEGGCGCMIDEAA